MPEYAASDQEKCLEIPRLIRKCDIGAGDASLDWP